MKSAPASGSGVAVGVGESEGVEVGAANIGVGTGAEHALTPAAIRNRLATAALKRLVLMLAGYQQPVAAWPLEWGA